MLKSVFSETSLFLEPTGTIYGAMICTPWNQYASLIMQIPSQLPCELWFCDLQCSWYTIHSDSVVVINIGMFIELEKSCHLSFSCKVFWYSFHWFFWVPHLWKYLFTLIEAWSIIAVGALLFLSVTRRTGSGLSGHWEAVGSFFSSTGTGIRIPGLSPCSAIS